MFSFVNYTSQNMDMHLSSAAIPRGILDTYVAFVPANLLVIAAS